MTKDVIVTIKGKQYDIAAEPIEITLPGTYYLKNGKHYVLYEEIHDDKVQTTKNRVKFHDGHFDMVKKGAFSSSLSFILNEKTGNTYNAGAGDVMMEVDTHEISIIETEEMLHAQVIYTLYINGQFISECEVDFKVQAR